jgi:hypothetical protein
VTLAVIQRYPASATFPEDVVMNLPVRFGAAVALIAPLACAFAADGGGLTIRRDDPWPRWQGRISLSTSAPVWGNGLERRDLGNPAAGSLSLMSDYYLTEPAPGPKHAGGFRATSGIVIGPRAQAWAGPLPGAATGSAFSASRRVFGQAPTSLPGDAAAIDTPSLPYVGVGYTGLSPRGGWSFSADLGVFSLSPSSAVKLGRVLGGSQGLDEALRDMRWSPVLQLGVSYSF